MVPKKDILKELEQLYTLAITKQQIPAALKILVEIFNHQVEKKDEFIMPILATLSEEELEELKKGIVAYIKAQEN